MGSTEGWGRTGTRPLREVGRVDGHFDRVRLRPLSPVRFNLLVEGAGREPNAGELWTVEVSLRLGGWNPRSSPPSRSKISFAILMAAPSRIAFCYSQNIPIDLKKNTIETKSLDRTAAI